jgi:hypothetical protein
VWRKNKIGFELPENEIINLLVPELKQLLEKSPLTAKLIHKNKLIRNLASLDHRTIWRLYNIVKWEEIFKVKVLNEK